MFSKGLVEGFLFQRLRQLHMGERSVANTKPQRTEKTWTTVELPVVLK